jgi:hypothetical protein
MASLFLLHDEFEFGCKKPIAIRNSNTHMPRIRL